MQYLALMRRRTEAYTEEQFAPFIEAERQQARQLYMDGTVRQIWHRDDKPGACLLIEAASPDEARTHVQTLPLVQAEMLELEMLVSLKPYAGFGPR
jgi:hypothetical protein